MSPGARSPCSCCSSAASSPARSAGSGPPTLQPRCKIASTGSRRHGSAAAASSTRGQAQRPRRRRRQYPRQRPRPPRALPSLWTCCLKVYMEGATALCNGPPQGGPQRLAAPSPSLPLDVPSAASRPLPPLLPPLLPPSRLFSSSSLRLHLLPSPLTNQFANTPNTCSAVRRRSRWTASGGRCKTEPQRCPLLSKRCFRTTKST